jgi:hypothetical protein
VDADLHVEVILGGAGLVDDEHLAGAELGNVVARTYASSHAPEGTERLI